MNAKHTGATKLPNQPKMSATDLKKAFDAPSKDVIAPKFNGLIDELEASTAAINIGAVTPAGVRTTIQETLNAKGDMKSSDYDAESMVIDAGGIVSYVSAAIVSKASISALADVAFSGEYSDIENAPTALADFTDDSTHRVVTDTEKTTWSGKMNADGSNASSHVSMPSSSLSVGERATGDVGNKSFSNGATNVASGNYSFASGSGCKAIGFATQAEGTGTEAEYDNQHVVGTFNDNKSGTLFEVGNGYVQIDHGQAEVIKQNAFEVYEDGNFSMDDGTTKFKFTAYNGEDGYYDKNGTFHAFGSGGGSGDMKKSDYDADEAVKLAGGIKAYVSSQISTAITSALTASY